MKKLLLSISAMFMALGMMAETSVTFDFDNNATALFGIEGRSSGSSTDGDITASVSATVGDVVLTIKPAESGTANRLWNSSPVLRLYSGNHTIAADGHAITKIVFNAGSKFDVTFTEGTLTNKEWVAKDEYESVDFKVNANTQLKSITVTLDGDLGAEPVVLAGTGEGTVESPYDVERALSVIENNAYTNDAVFIKGVVAAEPVITFKEKYGSADYYLAQGEKSLYVYGGLGYKGEKFAAEEDIPFTAGDELVIKGKLTNYKGTFEVNSNSEIYSINGVVAPEEPEYTPEGDGTEEKPYTVADVMNLKIGESDGNKYWVEGVILGSANSSTKLNTFDNAVDTNLALGATADATEFIPVELPKGDMRTLLGVATNPDNVGKKVKVYGTLQKYFSTYGVKGVTEFKSDELDAVEAIEAAPAAAEYFNLQGQRVANPANGIYIRRQGTTVTKVIVK